MKRTRPREGAKRSVLAFVSLATERFFNLHDIRSGIIEVIETLHASDDGFLRQQPSSSSYSSSHPLISVRREDPSQDPPFLRVRRPSFARIRKLNAVGHSSLSETWRIYPSRKRREAPSEKVCRELRATIRGSHEASLSPC